MRRWSPSLLVLLLVACDQRVELYPSSMKSPDVPSPPVLLEDGGTLTEDSGEPDAGLVDAGEADAGERDAGFLDASVPDAGVGDAGPIPPSTGPGPLLRCDQVQTFSTDDAGLPLLQSNPGAPLALFIDFNGGTYSGVDYGPFDRDGAPLVFDAQEQADVVASFNHLSHYFSMFDVNVTTDDAVRTASSAWGWVLVSEDMSGGSASQSASSLGQPTEARGVCGASSARVENPDKSRRIAAMLAYNFTLLNSGVWDGGTFWKWEDFPAWDRQYGPILGGGGLGVRNGWAFGHNSSDPASLQDDLEVIRQRVIAVGGSTTGWRTDDVPATTPASMCMGADAGFFAWGVLERPDDVDLFTLPWRGGDLVLEGRARDVSTAVITVDVLDGTRVLGGLGTTPSLAAGTYQLRVRSRGGYAELGAYEVRAR